MREIKFRGKRIDTNEWIYGDLLIEYYRNKMYCISEDTAFVTDIDGTFDDNNLTIIDSIHEVLPETVGQFTGFFDHNNIPIYENDHCSMCLDFGPAGTHRRKCTIHFDNLIGWGIAQWQIAEGIEIIGNVHE